MKRSFWVAAVVVAALAPLVASTPLACQGPCLVDGHSLGYRPPAAEVASGASVVFRSVDTVHVHAEQATINSAASCFAVTSNTGEDAPPVRFTINGSVLEATTDPGGVDESTATCNHATELDGGGWLLPFVCILHPVLMKGALVVTP